MSTVVTQLAVCSGNPNNPAEFLEEEDRQSEQQCHGIAATNTETETFSQPNGKDKKGRKIIVEMSKATATKMSKATGITLWSCNVCKEAKFEDYEAACQHEKQCLGMADNGETNTITGTATGSASIPPPDKNDQMGRTLIVEMSKTTAVAMSAASGITLWSCNVCKEAKFEGYNAACEHEKQCQRIKENGESNMATGTLSTPQSTTNKQTKRTFHNNDDSTSEEEWADEETCRTKTTGKQRRRICFNDDDVDNNNSTREEEEWADLPSKRHKSVKNARPTRKRRTLVAAAATGEEVIDVEDSSDEEEVVRAEPEVIDVDRPPSPISSPVATAAATAPRDDEEDDEDMEVWGGASDDDDVVEVVTPASTSQNQGSVLDHHITNNSSGNNEAEANEDEELQVLKSTGPLAFADFPHAREHCLVKPMRYDARQYCPKCYCYVCDTLAAECTQWATHCLAESTIEKWKTARETKRELDEACASKLASGDQESIDTLESSSSGEDDDPLEDDEFVWHDDELEYLSAILQPVPSVIRESHRSAEGQAFAAPPSSLAAPTNDQHPQSKRYKSTLQKLREQRSREKRRHRPSSLDVPANDQQPQTKRYKSTLQKLREQRSREKPRRGRLGDNRK